MSVRARRIVAAAPIVAILGAPAAVCACPFCASTGSSSDAGYIIATVILIALPVTLFAGLVHWLRRYERPDVAPPTEDPTR